MKTPIFFVLFWLGIVCCKQQQQQQPIQQQHNSVFADGPCPTHPTPLLLPNPLPFIIQDACNQVEYQFTKMWNASGTAPGATVAIVYNNLLLYTFNVGMLCWLLGVGCCVGCCRFLLLSWMLIHMWATFDTFNMQLFLLYCYVCIIAPGSATIVCSNNSNYYILLLSYKLMLCWFVVVVYCFRCVVVVYLFVFFCRHQR